MSSAAEFALVPLERLRGHEEVDPDEVERLTEKLRRARTFVNPIWVARDTWVILNGHHRVEAMRRLGAKRIAAWVFDYEGEALELRRWKPGPPISKSEVLRRAEEGRPFPPKTTRHEVRVQLPRRVVPLAELMV